MLGALALGAPASLRPARVPRTRRQHPGTHSRAPLRRARQFGPSHTPPSCRLARPPAAPAHEPLRRRVHTTRNRSTRPPTAPAAEPLRRNDMRALHVLRSPPGRTPWPTAVHRMRRRLVLMFMSETCARGGRARARTGVQLRLQLSLLLR